MPPESLHWRRGKEKIAEQDDWLSVEVPGQRSTAEPIVDRIVRIQADLKELVTYYKVEISQARYSRLHEFYSSELNSLGVVPFDSYSQEEKVDYLLLQNHLTHAIQTLELENARNAEFADFTIPFTHTIIGWIEARMRIDRIDPQHVAASFADLVAKIAACEEIIERSRNKYSKAAGFRAARMLEQLQGHLKEMVDFYTGYDPLWDWWVLQPYKSLDTALENFYSFVREKLVGIRPGDEDTIVGEPIGQAGLSTELKAEMIPYSPEELIQIAKKEYAWCEQEMIAVSTELGFGPEWRDALEYVKGLVEAPGSQLGFIKSLVDEGSEYVKKHSLVTVPRVAEEAIRMVMIPPSRQKMSPFFLGGPVLMVSYPRFDMPHADKMMSMRGNNRHFSKATAFHEMIPGHHLQLFLAERLMPHRQLFATPFYIEGWALYWEMVFWTRGDFFTSPEDRVGSLFWRMHRCARIIFSLKFHIGQMTPNECVDLLVQWVGHEQATAEGEVRRSLNGDYSPLYQASYLLGALQLWKLRGEVVDKEFMEEKEFHDAILGANMMPIEMLRALLTEQKLEKSFESRWKFYDL